MDGSSGHHFHDVVSAQVQHADSNGDLRSLQGREGPKSTASFAVDSSDSQHLHDVGLTNTYITDFLPRHVSNMLVNAGESSLSLTSSLGDRELLASAASRFFASEQHR